MKHSLIQLAASLVIAALVLGLLFAILAKPAKTEDELRQSVKLDGRPRWSEGCFEPEAKVVSVPTHPWRVSNDHDTAPLIPGPGNVK